MIDSYAQSHDLILSPIIFIRYLILRALSAALNSNTNRLNIRLVIYVVNLWWLIYMEMLEVMHLVITMVVESNGAWLYLYWIAVLCFFKLFNEFFLSFFHAFELALTKIHSWHIMVAEEDLIINIGAVE